MAKRRKRRFNDSNAPTEYTIKRKAWRKYTDSLRLLSDKASSELENYIRAGHSEDETLEVAHALVTKYGEASSELACQMYEALAEYSGAAVAAAEAADTATYGETARAIRGEMLRTRDAKTISSAAGRLVKLASVDTMTKNALRDGAEWAWIPSGDTCPYCLMLASKGWQRASDKIIKNGHATHIHNNCDCTFAVRLSDGIDVEGYDPDALYDEYINAGDTQWERINALRRRNYAANREHINAQKRAAYREKRIRDNIEFLEREAAEWEKRLSEAEKLSIAKYAYNSGDKAPNRFFERINGMLRGEVQKDSNLERHVENISSGIKKFNIEKGFKTYRRVDHNPAEGMNVGDVIQGEQFLSTSVDPEKALKKDYLIVVDVKEGTRAAYIDSLSEFDQTELLIDRDVFYKVKSITDNEVELEVII